MDSGPQILPQSCSPGEHRTVFLQEKDFSQKPERRKGFLSSAQELLRAIHLLPARQWWVTAGFNHSARRRYVAQQLF